MGDLTIKTPKPLLEVDGRPFLDILIERAASYGLRRFLLLTGYLGEAIADRYRTWGAERGLEIKCLFEPTPAGTAGALSFAAADLDDVFMLANGDTLFAVDLEALAGIPTSEGWLGKVALRRVADASRYGAVCLDGARVTSFCASVEAEPALINGGVYVLRREILGWITQPPCFLETQVFPAIVATGQLFAQEFDSYFIDIGIPEDLARARREIPVHLSRRE
ncbi:MAG: hypothetical protein K2P94_06855 [Rhodospirillaceae bacterium]|nr:hypothetical protein [Rhodospirillaceae bacterium]